ncbi:MAG TPA: tetratricopeptide repeat protein [Terriglobales bacterium]|nr:tetratricopeptide repeat protein [Terriglobales bacterium]
MAFGFGFKKQKVLSTAEKFVQQGKLQNAIAEYEKVLKTDSKDLTVLNTVGDLYARLGNTEKAVECFKAVGDAYAAQGFTVKAIAMYKKLSKLKSSLESVLRLAELYTQQGLFNDARAQYSQVADEFVRAGQLDQAVRIYQKTLEMDPENIAMRTKLAEVYLRLNKKPEAWQILTAAVEALRARGQLAPAEEILQRMLKLDPGSSYALRLRGSTALDAGDSQAAIGYLEKVADLDSNPDGLRTLMQAYLRTGRIAEAGALATKLFTVHNDPAAIFSYGDALVAAGQFEPALTLYQQHSERLLAADSKKILDTLHPMIGYVRDNPVALEMLLDLMQKAGDPTHLSEVYELLGHAWVQAGKLEKARDCYLKLTQLEPENQLHARNYQQVLGRLKTSSGSRPITPEEGAVLVDELEATAPFVDQRYPDDIAAAIRSALTDAELFISYNLPDKALRPLVAVVPYAPRDYRVNQKLTALHTRAGRFTEAAVCCRTLEGVYQEAGFAEEATRYGNLASQYEECVALASAGTAPEPIVGPQAPVQSPTAQPEFSVSAGIAGVSTSDIWSQGPPGAEMAAGGGSVTRTKGGSRADQSSEADGHEPSDEEIDLSAEWEGGFTDESEAVPATRTKDSATGHLEAQPAMSSGQDAVQEAIAEIRSYLAEAMIESAQAAYQNLRELEVDPQTLAAIHREIQTAMSRASSAPVEVPFEEAETLPEVTVDSAAADTDLDIDDRVQPAAFVESDEEDDEVEPAVAAGADELGALVKDLESSVGDDFLPKTKANDFAQDEDIPVHAVKETATLRAQSVGSLNQFVSDLETSLGDDFLAAAQATSAVRPQREEQPAFAAASAPSAMAAAASAGPGITPGRLATSFPAPPPTPPRPIPPLVSPGPTAAPPVAEPSPRVDLAGIFGELRQTLDEHTVETEEDPETHYNLGVAFREMGLLDEAIAEFQKVCKAAERDHKLPHIMQTYTWLAQCFLDKGVPEAAIRWYEKALQLPQLDQETRTALHYELAAALEAAGNKADALNHFLEVYGNNIDYRDVAERVKSLKS